MKFALPILAADGREFADARALDQLLGGEKSGHYLLGNHKKWHGGIHISDECAPWCRDQYPVRAIADGKVVAFRMLDHYLSSEFQGQSLRYSNCFCLIEHDYCETNPETQAKNEFTFYSLYMHLKPWQPEQDGERLVLKKRWNVRNSVPHHQPDAEQQQADKQLPAVPLPAGTELEPIAECEPVWGTLAGKDYRFSKVSITSALPAEVQATGQQAGVLLTQGSQVWVAEDEAALERVKPPQPLWLFDQIEAELTGELEGHADPHLDGPTGKLLAGGYNTSLPSGTQVQYDAHRLEFHWLDGKELKMARCHYRTPAQGSQPARTGVAWVCVEERNIRIRHQRPTHINQLYVLPSPVAIAAGETVGFLGLMENPGSLLGGKQSKYQVHLELFTQDPRLDAVLANQAGTAGGTRYAKVPAGLALYQQRDNQWVDSGQQSQASLLTAPKVEQSGDKQWLCVKEGAYVAKEQVEMLSQHDWLKLGFKQVDGSGSDGYLDPQQAPAFFQELIHCLDTNQDGHLSSEEITAALCNPEPILHSPQSRARLQKLIVRHPSEWYDKSAGASHQWLDKLKAQVAKPEFDQLVEHEKQRIDQLEWMQSASELKLKVDVWHFHPLALSEMKDRGRKLIWMKKVIELYGDKTAEAFREKVISVGDELKIDPNYIMACIALETVKRFSPSIRNPNSTATGLIQFMRNTALWLGTTVEQLSIMTHIEQMNYVGLYFKKISEMVNVATSEWTMEDVYFSIFTPSLIKMNNDDIIYQTPQKEYLDNTAHDINSDGAITKSEIAFNIRKYYSEGLKYEG